MRGLLTSIILPLAISGGAYGQSDPPPSALQDQKNSGAIGPPLPDGNPAKVDTGSVPIASKSKNPNKTEYFIAPVPFKSPAIGNGLAVRLGAIFRIDRKDLLSPPSMFAIGGIKSSNGTKGAFTGGRFFLKEDQYRVTVGLGDTDANYTFYGVGDRPNPVEFDLTQKVRGGIFKFQTKVAPNLYGGFRYLGGRSLLSSDSDLFPSIPAAEVKTTFGALAAIAEVDSADSQFYPTSGQKASLQADFHAPSLGDSFEYQAYQASYQTYHSLSTGDAPKDRRIIALSGTAITTYGRAPFYGLPGIGGQDNLRGYVAGKYIDRSLVSAQAEFRQKLSHRFGFAVFGGASIVGGSFGALSTGNLKPAVGLGIRYRLTKETPMNYRIDYAVGKDGGYLYFSIGEAF